MRSIFIASTTYEMCTGKFNIIPSNTTDANQKQQRQSEQVQQQTKNFFIKTESMPYPINVGSDSGIEHIDSNSNYSSSLNDDDETMITSTSFNLKHKDIIEFGPIRVRPRKNPAPTLATGRRSKYDILSPEEEHKRQIRRARNRAAAEKVRIRRLSIEERLKKQIRDLEQQSNSLINNINVLEDQKLQLESRLITHEHICMKNEQNDGTILLNENDLFSVFPIDNLTTTDDNQQTFNYLPPSSSSSSTTTFNYNNNGIQTTFDTSMNTLIPTTTTSYDLTLDNFNLFSQDLTFPDFSDTIYSQNNSYVCDELDELLLSK
ncbi:unnamed protein product [Didymodactylos carnosus]|uniref:BZIP domain-containing protein n=1 Tax=Didymodactylos carnosus TaxID=1234261 RepID=A0A814GYH9_9BILA|nr:unnamed protein product [Didymodactylos carnosus]CAF1003147.1 unnamed protein product [Didymodactylos carnosus]CAF3774547.1 unnamed protein product [Didymodactylos carnosus]CAF3774563.1 unnamed protein product [Didymodactylos carnosus]